MLSALLLLASPLAADVVTVDDSGGADFTDLQPAIDAAGEGDLVLVRAGSYGPFEVVGKALAIVADDAAVATGPGVVRDLAPGQTVVLRGLRVVQPAGAAATVPLLALYHDLGVVVVDACHLDGASSDPIYSTSALLADGCAGVFVTGSTIEAAGGTQFFVGPGPFGASHGIDARDSAVAVHGCDVRGGDGAAGWFVDFNVGVPPVAGAHGAAVSGGLFFAAGSRFTGGSGGAGGGWPGGGCWSGGAGGAGLAAADVAAQVLDTQLTGGAGGPATDAPCGDGASGAPMLASGSGSIGSLPAKAGALSAAPPRREGEATGLEVAAEPGALVAAFASLQSAFAPLPALPGYAALAAPFALGTSVVAPDGVAVFTAPVPELGAGVAQVVLLAQAIVLAPGAGPVPTGPAALVLLDAAR
jgi:hypothetical protein